MRHDYLRHVESAAAVNTRLVNMLTFGLTTYIEGGCVCVDCAELFENVSCFICVWHMFYRVSSCIVIVITPGDSFFLQFRFPIVLG